MYLKKWGGVGWWWVSSRSGWLLELLTELTTGGSERTFALGGRYRSHLDSVEELDPDTMTWNTIPAKLAEKKWAFGADALPRSLVCQA